MFKSITTEAEYTENDICDILKERLGLTGEAVQFYWEFHHMQDGETKLNKVKLTHERVIKTEKE